jgi:hypothetical protein
MRSDGVAARTVALRGCEGAILLGLSRRILSARQSLLVGAVGRLFVLLCFASKSRVLCGASSLDTFLRFTSKANAILVIASLISLASGLGLLFTGEPKPFLLGAAKRLLLVGPLSGQRLCFLVLPGQAGLFLLRERFSQPGLRLPHFLGELFFGFASRTRLILGFTGRPGACLCFLGSLCFGLASSAHLFLAGKAGFFVGFASGAGVFGSFAGNPGSCLGLTSGAGVLLGLAEKAVFFGLQRESFLGLASGSGFFLGLASDARLLFSFPGTSLRLGFPRKPVFFGFPGERFFSFALHPCLFLGRSGGAGLLLDLAGDALLFSFAGVLFVSFALRPGLFLGYAGGPRLFLGLTGGAGLRLGFARRLSLFCPCRLN